MKSLHDRHAECCEFSPDDQVLALLPLVGSPFQAKFSGPYTVAWKVSDLIYLISTNWPEEGAVVLKPCFAHSPVSGPRSLFSCVVAAVSAGHSLQTSDLAMEVEEDLYTPDDGILCHLPIWM